MQDGLTGGYARVETDVVAVGMKFAIKPSLHRGHSAPDLEVLVYGGIEVRLEVTASDDQRVSRAHRVAVADSDGERRRPDRRQRS